MPIEKTELVKIVVTAVVTLIARSLLSWFIKSTKRLAKILKDKIVPWINSDPKRFDLILQGLSCVWFFWMFYFGVPDQNPVTSTGVRLLVFLGCMMFIEMLTFVFKLKSYVNRNKGTSAND